MRMKVLLIFVCILVSVHGNAFEAKAICMEEIVDKRFKDLKFNGPIDVNYIFESYQEKIIDSGSQELLDKWLQFIELIEDSSCVYEFTSPEEDWGKLMGIKGLAIVEAGKVEHVIILKKS